MDERLRGETPLARVRGELAARAAGHWRTEAGALHLVEFAAAPGLPTEMAERFARATRSVALARSDLGIVRALVSGRAAVSWIRELPAETGSGYWLRAFGAERSVAVPLAGGGGELAEVVSVALAASALPDGEVADRIRQAFHAR